METNNLVKTYASKAVQSALMRSVYTWMTLALVITGFVSMYVAKSYTLLSVIMQNSMAFWGLIIAELGLVWYLSARINKMSFTTATVLFIVYSILNGVTLAFIFLIYTMSSIATTFFVTAGTFGVMLFSDAGKAVRFDEACVRSLGRTARGMGGMRLEGEDRVIALLVAEDDTQMVLTACENGYGKCTPISEYTRHARNTKGMIAIATTERNGRVIGAVLVHENDSVMFLSESGNIVRSPVSDVRVTGRAAQGVTLMDVRGDDRLIHIVRVAEDDLDNEGEGGEGDGEAGAAQTGAEDQETAENETTAPDTPSDTTDNN